MNINGGSINILAARLANDNRRGGTKSRSQMSIGWSDDRIADLKKHWLAGRSATQIMKILGGNLTRSAVIGKVHRLGLQRGVAAKPAHVPVAPKVARSHVAPPKPGPQNKPAVVFGALPSQIKTAGGRVYQMPDAAPLPPVKAEDIASPNALPFLQAKRGCKWPIGEGLAMLSCCNPLHRGVYCEGHSRIAFSASQPAQRDRSDRNAASFARHDRITTPRVKTESDGLWDAAA